MEAESHNCLCGHGTFPAQCWGRGPLERLPDTSCAIHRFQAQKPTLAPKCQVAQVQVHCLHSDGPLFFTSTSTEDPAAQPPESWIVQPPHLPHHCPLVLQPSGRPPHSQRHPLSANSTHLSTAGSLLTGSPSTLNDSLDLNTAGEIGLHIPLISSHHFGWYLSSDLVIHLVSICILVSLSNLNTHVYAYTQRPVFSHLPRRSSKNVLWFINCLSSQERLNDKMSHLG